MAKAGRPKKGSAGLPEWFDIEKYRHAVDNKAEEWYWQLVTRFVFHEKLCSDNSDLRIAKAWKYLATVGPVLDTGHIHEAFAEVGLSKAANSFIHIIEAPGRELMRRFMDVDDPVYGVRVMTNKDMDEVTMGGDALACDNEAEKEMWNRKPFGGAGFFADPFKRYMEIDFKLPDALLKKHFAECLRTSRKEIKKHTGTFFRSQDFSAWYNSGVLPYLDLLLWGKATGQTFRWSSFVDALSDIANRPVSSEEACRKTVKALASKLMNENTIFILNSQSLKERASSKKSGKLLLR